MTVKLPDVSEFQTGSTAPNWTGIKAQNGGAAIIRVSYGNAHLDTMLVHNRSQIKAAGYPFCGLYQYLRAGQTVSSQAQAFISWIGPTLNPGEIPMLDLEEGAGDQSGRAGEWFGIIDSAYNLTSLPLSQRSWLYSGQNFAISAGLAPIFNSPRRTWVAAYQSSEAGLLPHSLWQSTDGVTGANRTSWSGCGFVDTSIFHGALSDLAALGWHQPAQPSPPSPQPDQPEGENMLKATEKTTAISFGNSAYNWISFFCDNGVESKPTQQLRVAPWSSDTGFTGITSISVDVTNEKVTVQLPAHCAGISIQRPGQDPDGTLWCPVAWNLGV